MANLTITVAGALTTVQDMGRRGFAAKGYPECGAADKYAMQLANILAGNGVPNAADARNKTTPAVLECTLLGAGFTVSDTTLIALAGAVCTPAVNGKSVPMFAPVLLQAGDTLTMGSCQSGLRSYLAVFGGIDTPLVMGSRATDTKCGIGGLDGRALKIGDVLPCSNAHTGKAAAKAYAKLQKAAKKHQFSQAESGGVAITQAWQQQPLHSRKWLAGKASPILRVVLGPQDEAFTTAGIDTFTSTLYPLTADCNRMACKLKGTAIATHDGSDIISDGIVEGSVQVSSDGQPIVMLADHQTTGGYAKIATVIPPDVSVLAQLRPGDRVAFRAVSAAEAVKICRTQAKKLEWIAEQLA